MKKLKNYWGAAVEEARQKAATLTAEYTQKTVSDNVPADLADTASLGLETSRGYALSGRLLQSEFIYGSRTPVEQLSSMLIPPVLALTTVLLFWLPAWLAFIPALAWVLFTFTTAGVTLGLVGGVVALFLLSGSDLSLLSLGGGERYLQYGAGITLTVLSLLALPLARVLARSLRRAEIHDNAKAGAIVLSASRQEEARRVQAERAARDDSPLIWLGEAVGMTWEKGDVMAPDPASRVALSAGDMSTGLLVLGGTGTGKTSGIFRPVIRQWTENDCGGLLVMDGKGQLPAELAGTGGLTLLSPDNPATPVALIAGLNAEEVAATILAVANKGGGKESDWTYAAETLLRMAALLVELAAELGESTWTLAAIQRVINDAGYRDDLIQAVTKYDEHLPENLRITALDFWLKEYPEKCKAEAYVASVNGIVTAWLAPLTGHRKMHAWINAEHGLNPLDVLNGARFGLNLDAAVYGQTCAATVSGLIKKRLYNAATQRGDGWKKDPDNTAAMIVMDEADVLLDAADADIMPRGRSLGLNFVVGIQTVEQVEAAFGGASNAPKAHGMLAQLRSVIALSSTHHTARYVADRIGFGVALESASLATVPDMRYTALRRAAAAPFNDPDNECRSAVVSSFSMPEVLSHSIGRITKDHKTMQGERLRLADKPAHWISPEEINMLTATEGVAVAVLNRAGAPRRDAIRLAPEYAA